MAIGPLDELRTRLTLEGNFKKEAGEAKGEADKLAESILKLEEGGGALSGTMGSAAGSVLALNPALQSATISAVKASTAIGTQLGTAISSAATFILSPAGLVAGLTIASAAVVTLTLGASALTGAMLTFGSAVASIIPTVAGMLTTVLAPAMALPFIKASAEMDRFERQFTAIFGGQKQGQMVTDFMRQYGLTSPLSQPSIAQLIRVIGMGGRDISQLLPVAETLSLAGREDPDTNARDIASIFMRLAGGQIADAFGPEGLGRFGINREMLGGAGAKFDKSGSFIGSVDEAFAVLETLTKTHPVLKDMRALMEQSTDTRLSNAWDAVQLAIQNVGKIFATELLPIIETAAGWIRNLAQNGALAGIAKAFTSIVDTNMDGIKTAVAFGLAFVKNIPRIIDAAMEFVRKMPDFLMGLLSMVAGAVRNIPLIGPAIADAMMAGALGAKAAMAGLPSLGMNAMNFITDGNFGGDVDYFKAMLDREGKPGTGELPVMPPTDPEAEKAQMHLAAIENNTRQMVEAQRLILGGGELGQQGITATSVFGRKSGGGGRRGGFVGDRLSAVLMDIFDEMIEGERRAMA